MRKIELALKPEIILEKNCQLPYFILIFIVLCRKIWDAFWR